MTSACKSVALAMALIVLAGKAVGRGQPMVWLIDQAPSGADQAAASADRFTCGIIIAAETEAPDEVKRQGAEGARPIQLFIWACRASVPPSMAVV